MVEAEPATQETNPATRYRALQETVAAYGAAAFENMCRCRKLADAVLSGFAPWLGAPCEKVSGVPATGAFDPRRDYGEAAFSYHGRQAVLLEPVTFGVSLIVDNHGSVGAIWLRAPVAAKVSGDQYDVYVGAQARIRTPLEFGGRLDPIYQAIDAEMRKAFERDVDAFHDAPDARIGFLME